MCYTSRGVEVVLWHQRLLHRGDRIGERMHQVADGVPKLPRHEDWNPCHTCILAKMKKMAAGSGQANPHVNGKHLAADVGFVVQKSCQNPINDLAAVCAVGP